MKQSAKREINYDKERREREIDVRGPTQQRLGKAAGGVHIGGEDRGVRIYQFCDTPLDRLYSRLTRGRGDHDGLRLEYAALVKYRNHFIKAGKEVTIASVDPNNTFGSSPFQRCGMPMADFQIDHGTKYRQALSYLGHKPGIVVDNVVCSETSLEVAGWSIGYNSRTSARDNAERILRESGRELAKLWGIG